jgi:TolA-binding protein
MRKYFLLITITIVFINTSRAGDLNRAFKFINTGDYDKAQQNIREELNDDNKNVAANYAMAKLYESKDFKKYNIDSATIYINKSYAAVPLKPDDKQAKKYLKLGVRDFTIKQLFDEINQIAFTKAKTGNSFESYDHFLTYSADPALNVTATDKRDEIRFEELKIREELQPLKDFLNNYPKSKKFEEANALYEKLLYEQMTKPDTYEAYKTYLDKYPTGPYAKDAKTKYEERIYGAYIKKNKLEDYMEFEKSYPKNPFLSAVQDSIYTFSTRNHTTGDYNAFIKSYPSNRHIMDAWNSLYDLYTQNATDSDYALFQKIYPNNPLKERIQQDQYLSKLPLATYKQNDKFGYVNTATQVLAIEPQYYDANDFSDGLAAVAIKPCSDSCYYSYIDKSGRVVIENTFASGGDFANGKAIVATSYCDGDACEYGIINRRGEFIVAPIYQDLQQATEGLFAAHNAKGYGFIDETGKTIIPFIYQDATPFSEGTAAVKKDSVWIYIDRTGQKLFPQTFKEVTPYVSGLAAVSDNDSTYGYINKYGNWAIVPIYEFAEPFEGDTAIVTIKEINKRSKEYGISARYKIDKTGKNCYKIVNPNATARRKQDKKKGKKR